MAEQPKREEPSAPWRGGAWTHLGLTLPIFVAYHLGVAVLPMRNAADLLTIQLRALVQHSLFFYALVTLSIGSAFLCVTWLIGREDVLSGSRFLIVGAEGVAYGIAMRLIGAHALGALPLSGGPAELGGEPFASVVMALGAGFYEELVFRVGLFGVGAWLSRFFLGHGPTGMLVLVSWAVVCALAFSGWHHVGDAGEAFVTRVFVYRAVCGLVLTTIYLFRGFAPAVWTHALYDVWALSA